MVESQPEDRAPMDRAGRSDRPQDRSPDPRHRARPPDLPPAAKAGMTPHVHWFHKVSKQ